MKDHSYAYPPRHMGIEEASRYLGVSASTFRNLGICPVNIGSRVLWDRQSLDLYADRLSGRPLDDADRNRAAGDVERDFLAKRRRG